MLLKSMGIPASVHIVEQQEGRDPSGARCTLDIQGDDLGILIGRKGQTLLSLQYIVNLILSHRLKSRVPVTIDVEGYKQRRYERLQQLALRLADQVLTMGQPMPLEPMPANERRTVHLALSTHPSVITESIGEGESRKVVIMPK